MNDGQRDLLKIAEGLVHAELGGQPSTPEVVWNKTHAYYLWLLNASDADFPPPQGASKPLDFTPLVNALLPIMGGQVSQIVAALSPLAVAGGPLGLLVKQLLSGLPSTATAPPLSPK